MHQPPPKTCRTCSGPKTQLESGHWYCRKCQNDKRIKREAAARVAQGLPAIPPPRTVKMDAHGNRLCKNDHIKTQRPGGHWVCDQCHDDNRRRRDAERRVQRGQDPRPYRAQSEPTGTFCKYGHEKVRTPTNRVLCQVCRNLQKKARAEFEKAATCGHFLEPGFRSLRATDGTVVCVTCLVEAANKQKTGGAA